MITDRKISISVSLETHQVEQLNKIIEQTKLTRSVLVREAVQEIIEKYEKQLELNFQKHESDIVTLEKQK